MATQPTLQNPDTSLTPQERNTVITDPQEWNNSFARKTALQDFQAMETFRAQNHDRRFRESDRLLTGWRPQRLWEGTRIPRSNVPIFIGLQEIEVLLPRVLQVIFSDNPPFEFMPEPGSPLAAAFAVKSLLASQLRDIGKPGQFMTAREICRRAYKSGLSYGAGIVEFGWLIQNVNRIIYDRRVVAETVTINHPEFGPVQVPTGGTKIVAQQLQDKRIISKPLLTNVDIRDYYIDPDCTGPNVQEARFDATRHLVTVEEIKEYANIPGFNVPDDKTLLDISKQKVATQGDTSKQMQESWRGNQYQPGDNKSVDPALGKIELIRYNRKNRMVWLLGRQYEIPLYNECNPYGMLPHLNSFYTDFLGRFYGFSIIDLVEGDHKLAAEIINSRIDELNLILNAPLVRKRGLTIGKRFHPGAQWEVPGNPKEDVVRMDMGTVNPSAFAEVNALENRVQKLTGNTDIAAFGVQTSGGDSANRTATGVAAKTGAANSRIEYQVENFEDQFLEPLLYILLALNKKYIDPNKLIELTGPDGQAIKLDPLTVLNADGQFEVRASAKMRTRQALQGGGLQMLLSTYLNPGYLDMLKGVGMTVDGKNMDKLVCDGLNIPQMQLIRPMTPQEQQAAQQPPIEALLKMQMQQDRLQEQAENQDSGDETSLLKAVLQLLSKLITPDAAHAFLGMPAPAKIAADAQPKQLTNGKSKAN